MHKLITILFLFVYAVVFASEVKDYNADKIDPQLLKGANAVKREESIRLLITDPANAVYQHKYVVTILNEAGDKYATFVEWYNKSTVIKSVSANLYDGKGVKIRSAKNADIRDVSASGADLADDNRVKYFNFSYKIYPYTVEYEVELKKSDLFFMPSWHPVEDIAYSVENSSFEISCPVDFSLRYKSYNLNLEPAITDGKSKNYHWELKNFSCIRKEFAAPGLHAVAPIVLTGINDFSFLGFKGNMSNWKEFGKFVYSLKDKRDELPGPIKQTVHSLTDGISDEHKKVEVLYDYLQHNTRYVSIQLGIGGWQPFTADFVAEKKYGDCKALTNYMFSLLKEAGVTSIYTLVKAGRERDDIYADFPAQQFNHVILMVPMKKDSVWLECTSQTLPAGYLGSFTCDRDALCITEDGGQLVRTPVYRYSDNRASRVIKGSLDEAGNVSADVISTYTGLLQEHLFQVINSEPQKEQLEFLKREIKLPDFEIDKFDFSVLKSKIPAVTENVKLTAKNYATVTGKRMLFEPNLLAKQERLFGEEERTQDINFKNDNIISDTIELTIPEGYSVESYPSDINISGKCSVYRVNFKSDNKKIVYTRTLTIKAGTFPKADFQSISDSFEEIYKNDRAVVVLKKKEG